MEGDKIKTAAEAACNAIIYNGESVINFVFFPEPLKIIGLQLFAELNHELRVN